MRNKIAALVIVFVLLSSFIVTRSVSETLGGAALVGIQGDVEVRAGGTGAWRIGELKQALAPGTSVRTKNGAGAVLLFSNGSTIKLNENTEFTLPRGGEDAGDAVLDEGELWGLLETDGGLFEINTPSAVLAVRGTEFALLVKGGGESTVTVVAGETTFSNEYGGVNVGASMQSTARPGQAPTPPKVVDTRNWIKWTLELRAMGSDIATPFYDMSNSKLKDYRDNALADLEETGSPAAQMEYACALYDLGEYSAAVYEFLECADYDETAWECMFGLGLSALAGGGVDEAFEYFDNLATSIDNYVKGYSRNEYGEESARHMAFALSGFGLAYLKEGNPKEALKNFQDAADYNPDLALAYTGMAEALIRLGKAKDAKEQLEISLDIAPGTYQALTRLAAVEMSLNRPGPALDAALDAVDAMPDSARTHGTLARVRFFREEFAEAEQAAREALRIDPYEPAAHEILARLLIRDGDMRGAVREALVSYTFDENSPYANDDLAMIYYVYRKYDAAIRHWEKAIDSAPDYAAARIHLAHLYNGLEETDKARRAEELMLDVLDRLEGAQKAEALSEYGRSLEMLRRYKEAEDAFLEALAIDPENALNLRRLAEFYTRRHWPDLALEYALRAVSAQPRNPANYFVLGRAYESVNNVEGAESAYLTATILDPEYAIARYQLGAMYADKGKTRDSLSEMLTGILMQPRLLTLAEYRGASRIGGTVGSEDLLGWEAVHTGSTDNYRLSYNIYYNDLETEDDRPGADSESQSFNLMLGYQDDADSSLVAHILRAGSMNDNLPSDNDLYTTDELRHRTFYDLEQNSLSWRQSLSPKTTLTLRADKSKSVAKYRKYYSFYSFSDDTDAEIETTEYEIELDVKKTERFEFSLGAFWNNTDFFSNEVYTLYDSLTGAIGLQDSYQYRMDSDQRNTYFEFTLHDVKPRLDFTAGVENALRDDSGSEVLYKLILEYEPEDGAWLRFVRRTLYFLDGFPLYRPRDGWISLDEYDAGSTGSDTTDNELEYEKRFENGAFFRASAYVRKTWDRFSGVIDTDGFRARLEKPVSRKLNYFVAVAHNNSDYDRYVYTYYDGGLGTVVSDVLDGKTVAYSHDTDYEIGFYYFFSSRFALKATYNKYDEMYSDLFNTNLISDYELTNLEFRYEPRIDHSYVLKINNVFDEEYQKIYGQREDGRNWEFSVKRWF